MRTRTSYWIATSLLAIAAASCGGEDTIDGFSQAEWDVIESLSPLPDPPADPTNRVADDPAAADLGQALFFDKGLSGPILFEASPEEGALGELGEENKFACTSCHDPANAFVDARSNPPATSLGTGGFLGRNAFTMINAVYYEWSGWNGFIDTYWGHAILGIEAAAAANGDRLRTAHLVFDKYRSQYEGLFGPMDPALDPDAVDADRFPPVGKPKAPEAEDGPWEAMTPEDQEHATEIMVNAGKAMGAYFRLLIKRDAPFDQYVAGDFAAISPQAKNGLKLFIGKAACVECHEGPFFSDQKFHNIGIPQEGEHVPAEDVGRPGGIAAITGGLRLFSSAGPFSDDTTDSPVDGLVATDEDLGTFRTQGLRNVLLTPPYMHTGQFNDLREVVEFYNKAGGDEGFVGVKDDILLELNLSESEMDDIVAFLESITGAPLPPALEEDTSAP